jgi:hypothetical protein
VELRAVADKLYGLRPGDFTQARNDEAAAAKAAGDIELAAAIRTLRKPSTSAWWINTLVRQATPLLDELLALGAEMRATQQRGAIAELRQQSNESHQLVGKLGAFAADLAAADGQLLGNAVLPDLVDTFNAALSDETASEAVRSGRLVRALEPGGFGPVDLEDAVAVPGESAVPAGRRLRAVKTPAAEPKSQETAAQQALDGARSEAAVAERAVTKANSALDRATSQADVALSGVEEAERAFTNARDNFARAEAVRDAASKERDDAVRIRDDAQRAVTRAETTAKRPR